MIFGKYVWPVLGKPCETALRRESFQGSAIFAGAAACLIPFSGFVLASFKPTTDESTPVAMSPWFGYTGDGTQTRLDGNGKLIIGTFGRQGMNMNKIGLIVDGPGTETANDK